MNKRRFTISITAGIAVVLLLIGGTGTTIILFNTGYAQTATLGEPIFVEEGEDTLVGEIGPNRTQHTFTSNGTMNGNIEYDTTGEYVSFSKGNNLTFDQGHAVMKTKDGGETANYTFIEVFNGTDFQGASVYSTNSTGKLSVLDNALVIYKIEQDESGNYVDKQWLWK
ncbi:MAG: hypothetical protein QOA17_06510 [Nitrososphaeraceae archaeon]|nr:hypothetical protein [Nitrososphaeraceae archaeon]MDW0218854.1 hypothetical protein [Nitrososphaeraceae archaeon]MDW0251441.1 hypothetical protein [Nitrososphaeraceae archaeon]MDW0300621.1 hypothetical protein [Nitrososphaeraceae archaeon]MDW0328878.1 hypothetical protein [Nitrososphaeraceae archaeon]